MKSKTKTEGVSPEKSAAKPTREKDQLKPAPNEQPSRAATEPKPTTERSPKQENL